MTRKRNHEWQSEPGSFDALHTRYLFPADNRWGIPALAHTPLPQLPRHLLPYGQRVRTVEPLESVAIHFFLDDYRFERVWNRPFKALTFLQAHPMVLTPDFSLYHDWPLSVQLWNTYRSRWCGCFWQAQGLTVIPTVSWGTEQSYRFCFTGIPRRSVVAISTVGVDFRHLLTHHLFVNGYHEMVKRLEPVQVLCYGLLPASCSELVPMRTYPPYWTRIRAMRRERERELELEEEKELERERELEQERELEEEGG